MISGILKDPKALISIAVCVVGAAWLLAFGWKPKLTPIPTHTVANAEAAAIAYATATGGEVFRVTDTGSMRPLLTGGECVVTVRNYTGIKVGAVVVYRPTFATATGNPLIHRAAQLDKYGWIMSGDSAPHTESWARVTEANYIGTVVAIFRQ